MERVRSNRLLKELLEIRNCPVPNINVIPLNEENLAEWHGNIQGIEGSEWSGIIVHFIVTFPIGYPSFPPRVQLCSFVPHLNVQSRGGTWEICLDMLENPPLNSLTIPYKYWSSAFSIRSILIQLSSFLLTEDHTTENSIGNIDRTRRETQQFSCICGHSHTNHIPSLPTEVEILKSPMSYPCIEVIGEGSKLLESRISHRKEIIEKQKIFSKSNWNEVISKLNKTESYDNTQVKVKEISETSNYATILSTSLNNLIEDDDKKDTNNHHSETNNNNNNNNNTNTNNNNCEDINEMNNLTNNNTNHIDNHDNISTSQTYSCSLCLHKLEESCFTKSQLKKGLDRKCINCIPKPNLNEIHVKKSAIEILKSSVVGLPIVVIDKNEIRREKQKNMKKMEKLKNENIDMKYNDDKKMILKLEEKDKIIIKIEDHNGLKIKKVINNNNNNNNNNNINHQVEMKEVKNIPINTMSQSVIQRTENNSINIYNDFNKKFIQDNNNCDNNDNMEDISSLTSIETDCNMGLIRKLNRDTAIHLLSFLTVKEIAYLGSTSRGVECLCNDWVVWRRLFKSHYPRSALKPSGNNCCWKRAYMLEINCLSEDLMCFNSRVTKKEGILGFPIWFTTNPKTGCLDYATSTFDILSYESYSKDMIRRTVWGEKFTHFLPIYIDKEHFDRSMVLITCVSKEIIEKGFSTTGNNLNNYGGKYFVNQNQSNYKNKDNNKYGKYSKHNKYNQFNENINNFRNLWIPQTDYEKVLTFLTKMMNTQVVLLCDKGITASEVALMGYCQLHRLLLAFVDKYPELRIVVRRRLEIFATKPECRVKEFTPSLGELLALLSVSDTYGWKDLSMVYLKECFDRSVLWACTKDKSLSKVIHGDMSRLDKYLETQKVSLRLTLFHAVFLRMLVQGGGSRAKLDSCIDRYDTFQGRPPLYIRREWQKVVKEILEFSSWPEFFRISEIPLPTKEQLLSTLEKSVTNSLKKGYHTENTIFENVMKSGVSQILLKGETYSTSPTLKKIQMLEKWRFDGGVRYLDASCLIYDINGNNIGIVDFSNTKWRGPPLSPNESSNITKIGSFVYGFTHRTACIRHSGDVIDRETGTGTHTIDIEIDRLPSCVGSLYFTVSAWTTTLKEINQPSAHLHDAEQDVELCRYKLEDTDTGSQTSVIMCKLYRTKGSSRWKLLSIGKVGMGRAGNYDPILKSIKKLIKESNKEVVNGKSESHNNKVSNEGIVSSG